MEGCHVRCRKCELNKQIDNRSSMNVDSLKTILLVDDDEDCRLIIRDTIESSNFRSGVFEVSSGEEALAFTHRQSPFENAPIPDLIYLDIEMTGLNGIEVLKKLREDIRTKKIPIVMMTGMDDDQNKTLATQYGANSYCLKPSDPAQFHRTILQATDYWLNVHCPPPIS